MVQTSAAIHFAFLLSLEGFRVRLLAATFSSLFSTNIPCFCPVHELIPAHPFLQESGGTSKSVSKILLPSCPFPHCKY